MRKSLLTPSVEEEGFRGFPETLSRNQGAPILDTTHPDDTGEDATLPVLASCCDASDLTLSDPDSPSEALGCRAFTDKKRNGIFYTPDRATRILARWAIDGPDEKVLEPSFGGCGFLAAAKDRLLSLGNTHPEDYLYGCDVDPAAFGYLAELFGEAELLGRFQRGDFLKILPDAFGTSFDSIIGNPPYVSLHNMDEYQRRSAWSSVKACGITVSKKASLWAYFILHALNFLRPGGRMAWLLPGSFLHSDYSGAIREKLASVFSRSFAVQLEERLFLSEGTEESTVILLCEGFGQAQGTINIARATDLDHLEKLIGDWSSHSGAAVEWSEKPQLALLRPSTRTAWEALRKRWDDKRLSSYLTLRIGIVTGANKFFILDHETVASHELPEDVLQPVLARFSQCSGLRFTAADIANNQTAGARCLLFDTTATPRPLPREVTRYLESFPVEDRKKNRTFAKRKVWHQPLDQSVPDAFFSAMHADGPTLVLNDAGVPCSNSIYRCTFSPSLSVSQRELLAVALQSTPSQLSAEIEGRSYGSGGLKLEPSEATRILVGLPSNVCQSVACAAFEELDKCLRKGDRSRGRNIADELLIEAGWLRADEACLLETELLQLRKTRRGSFRNGANG